jgi:GNAT superfamily N-acetyltransferase
VRVDCFECGATIDADNDDALADSLLAHARSTHEWPYGDQSIRNYAAATQRLTGSAERLAQLGELVIHPVTESRLDDWLAFFDHDAFVGTPQWADCYCLEPHVRDPGDEGDDDAPRWQDNRDAMLTRLRDGRAFGYLAYVDGRAAGWVNAAPRSCYALYRLGANAEPADDDVIGVSCFIIAPPYRRHGVAAALLDRVLADAGTRGVRWVEAYPFNEAHTGDAPNFRGPRSLYDERGFSEVERRARDTVVRRAVG